MNKTAITSSCERYRYSLGRDWVTGEHPVLVFCMLNPSTADAVEDDPTIRRCIAFAKREGFGGIRVVNLFAWRATDPANLPARVHTATGPANDEFVAAIVKNRPVVVAWGANAAASAAVTRPFLAKLRQSAASVYCLGTTKSGAPRHPLYVKGDTPLQEVSHDG